MKDAADFDEDEVVEPAVRRETAEDDGWGEDLPVDFGKNLPAEHDDVAAESANDGWGDRAADHTAAHPDDPRDISQAMAERDGHRYDHEAEATVEAPTSRLSEQDDRARRLEEARAAVEDVINEASPPELDELRSTAEDLPVPAEAIAERTTANRIDLADDVADTALTPEYGGYLDVVMHGDEYGTEARVDASVTDFSMEQTAHAIEASPSWDHRPVRFMSCSVGKGDFAQELADRLEVPVYAPDDLLQVGRDGSLHVLRGGAWRRFEPSVGGRSVR